MALDESTPGAAGQGGNEPGNQPGLDWEHQYNELRPAYTQATQALADAQRDLSEYEQIFDALNNPETQAQALQALGIALENGGPSSPSEGPQDEDFTDPLEAKVNEIAQAVQQFGERFAREDNLTQQQQLDAARDEFIGNAIDIIERSLSQDGKPFKFTDKEESTLGNLAIAMQSEDGIPDIEGAYEALYGNEGLRETWRSQYIDTKRTAGLPPLVSTLDLERKPANAKERVAFFNEKARLADME